MTKKEDQILTAEGTIVETLPNISFKVELDGGGELLAKLSGRARRHRIRILLGDRVRLEYSPHDPTRGRIVYRYK